METEGFFVDGPGIFRAELERTRRERQARELSEKVTGAIKGAGLGKKVLLLTDGRFSGGTTGLCVGHISPEAVDGGAIALIKDGDRVRIDIPSRKLDLLIDASEFEKRRSSFSPLPPRYNRGVLHKYTKLVGSASKGAVCD